MKKQCSVEGCQNKYYAKSFCEKHYQRNKKYWSPKDKRWDHNIWIEKFWNNIDKNWISVTDIWTPCWLLNWSKSHWWYMRLYINWIEHRWHCLSWKIHNNQEIPPWMHICHKCDTPACVNPEHLFLWTPKENAQDKVKKWRARTGDHRWEKCWKAKLTEKQVLEIRNDNRSNIIIAKDYNIDKSSISDIKRRKTWKHI